MKAWRIAQAAAATVGYFSFGFTIKVLVDYVSDVIDVQEALIFGAVFGLALGARQFGQAFKSEQTNDIELSKSSHG